MSPPPACVFRRGGADAHEPGHAGGRFAHDHVAVATTAQDGDLRAFVTQTVRPVMKRYGISGMAVGLTVDGRHYVFDYGLASKATRTP
jgi:hypothetical protein